MTKDNDLVKRLRLKRERCHDLSGVYYTEDADCHAAADRIEKLEAENKRLKDEFAGLAQAAMNNGQGLLIAEAKLAKAMRAMRGATASMRRASWGMTAIACATLTEIEGDKT